MVKWSKTSPFHGGNPSSNLGRVTKEKTFERMSFLFPTVVGYFISARYACRTRDTRLTASEERRKREAFADIERSGHSEQIKHEVAVQGTVVRYARFVQRRRVALQVNLLAPLLRQSLTALPTNSVGSPKKRHSNECLFFFSVSTLLFVLTKATISRLHGVLPNCRKMLLNE